MWSGSSTASSVSISRAAETWGEAGSASRSRACWPSCKAATSRWKARWARGARSRCGCRRRRPRSLRDAPPERAHFGAAATQLHGAPAAPAGFRRVVEHQATRWIGALAQPVGIALRDQLRRRSRDRPVEPLEPSAGRSYARDDVAPRSEEHTSELQSHVNLVCRLLLEKKKQSNKTQLPLKKKKKQTKKN